MKIDFKIAEVPTNEDPKSIHYYVEGPLTITIDHDVFFNEEVLLIELATIMQK